MEIAEVYVGYKELDTDGGQAKIKLVLGPMGIKDARRLDALTSGGKLKVVLE